MIIKLTDLQSEVVVAINTDTARRQPECPVLEAGYLGLDLTMTLIMIDMTETESRLELWQTSQTTKTALNKCHVSTQCHKL